MTEGGNAVWFDCSGLRVGVVVPPEGEHVDLRDWPWPTVALRPAHVVEWTDDETGVVLRSIYALAEVGQRGDVPTGGTLVREAYTHVDLEPMLWPVFSAGAVCEVLHDLGMYPNLSDVVVALEGLATADNTD
ncbi:hypothetical protein SEA_LITTLEMUNCHKIN_73 [Gordonia phage LittleMunchkin]|nr:hypothetical protein SEA_LITTLEMUNCHKIN_73 [Gordonia phage LittleMunchkin]